jgi:N-acetylmuramoyl-L-alanine amidase
VSNGGILVEIEFLSHPERLQVFKDKMWLVGKAVAQVVLDYVKTQK